MFSKQIKSKKRVAAHGEVFTSERDVNAMLDLVRDEAERIDSRFLEPACGTGNFLITVLERKLDTVRKWYAKSKLEYEKFAFLAISSIYGVELLEDNVEVCRQRLLELFVVKYKKLYKRKIDFEYIKTIEYILSRNILSGDALTMQTTSREPIVFSEWSLVTGDMVKRRDFEFTKLLAIDTNIIKKTMVGFEYDDEIHAFIPAPIKEYSLINYRRIQDAEK